MVEEHDPVDSALRALRGQQWKNEGVNPKLEEKLMQAYQPHSPSGRFGRRHTLIASLAVLLIAGGTIAATGGVAKLKRWLVRVEVNGQVHEFETGADGAGTFNIETEDGGEAEVHVQVATEPGEGDTRRVQIRAESPGQEEVEAVALRRRQIVEGEEPLFGAPATLDDLEGATLHSEWESNGVLRQIYVQPNADDQGEGFRIFCVTSDADGQQAVHLVAAPPVPLPDDLDDLEVDLTEDDTLTVGLTTPDGREVAMELKMRTATGEACDPDAPLTVGTPDGQIQITLTGVESEDD
jgi:hypothetical protein